MGFTWYVDSGGAATNSGSSDSASPIASGTSNATIVTAPTFNSATAPNTGTDLITVTAHGLSTGYCVALRATSGSIPGGFSASDFYFVRAVDVDTLSFHLTKADADANTNLVNITSTPAGTTSIDILTIVLGGTPDLSTIKPNLVRLTTSGTSHVFTFPSAHGLTTEDEVSLAGNIPTGLTSGAYYYVDVLTSTTVRLHTSPQAAAAAGGGASAINVSAQTTYVLIKSTQSQYLNLASSSVTNRKIFLVTSVDDTNDWAFVATANITGLGAGSSWAIGGQISSGGLVDLFNSANGLDTVLFNTDISAALNLVARQPSVQTEMRIVGKAGARRVLANTGNGTLITMPATTFIRLHFENMELQSQGTGGIFASASTNQYPHFKDCRLTDSGTNAVSDASQLATMFFHRTEISGSAGSAIVTSPLFYVFIGQCYIHDNTSIGFNISSGGAFCCIVDSIFDRNGSHNISLSSGSSTTGVIMYHNTLYRAGGDGIRWGTVSAQNNFTGIGNIFKDNGNVSTEANFKDGSIGAFAYSRDSAYNIGGGLGGVNFFAGLGEIIDSSDTTNDPLLADPNNAGGAASRDFSLQDASPVKSISFTFLGSLTETVRDGGAANNQSGGGGGGGGTVIVR